MEISLGKIVEGVAKGIGDFLGFAVEMEKEGKSTYEEEGEIKGTTESGKEYLGAYGFRVKIGINENQKSSSEAPVRPKMGEGGNSSSVEKIKKSKYF
ncbi:MAG: hypothetical protein HYW78_02715 [Parcubacteria group bacterium]|nr:hypothetical protein [Parcubacteria group bacterium]